MSHNTPDLLPCPFCGATCEHEIDGDEEDGFAVYITANHMKWCPFAASYQTGADNGLWFELDGDVKMEEFLNRWNQRTIPATLATFGLRVAAAEFYSAIYPENDSENLEYKRMHITPKVRESAIKLRDLLATPGEGKEGAGSEASAGAGAPEDMIPGPTNPFPGPVDFTKPVRTKGGKYPVRIIAIDNSLAKPIIGVMVGTGCHFDKEANSWHANGQYHPATPGDCLDLENIPEASK